MVIVSIIIVMILFSVFELAIIMMITEEGCGEYEGLELFNPIRNYKYWTMNWFGVGLFTLILNIICPVLSLCYWFYKLCTVGRE